MLRFPVDSTNIASVGYENFVLEVEFLDGSIYQYLNVPENVFQNLISFPHPGTYLSRFVKGQYTYRRVR